MRKLNAVDVVGLNVFAVSALLVEPEAVLVDVSLDALKGLLAVDIGNLNLYASWLVEVVAFVSNTLDTVLCYESVRSVYETEAKNSRKEEDRLTAFYLLSWRMSALSPLPMP